MGGTLSGAMLDGGTVGLRYRGIGLLCSGVLWDECILGRGISRRGYCGVGYSALRVVFGGATDERGILSAGGT